MREQANRGAVEGGEASRGREGVEASRRQGQHGADGEAGKQRSRAEG